MPLPYRSADREVVEIVEATAKEFGRSPDVLISKDQRLRLSLPRQVAFYLLRNEAGCSLPEIATYMERDHTTVMYGIDRVQNLLATNDNTAEHLRLRIESIRQRVRKGAAA